MQSVKSDLLLTLLKVLRFVSSATDFKDQSGLPQELIPIRYCNCLIVQSYFFNSDVKARYQLISIESSRVPDGLHSVFALNL